MEKSRIHFYLEEIRAQKGISLEEMESRLQIGRRKLQRFFAGTGKEASAALTESVMRVLGVSPKEGETEADAVIGYYRSRANEFLYSKENFIFIRLRRLPAWERDMILRHLSSYLKAREQHAAEEGVEP